jgi:hypothetical protein
MLVGRECGMEVAISEQLRKTSLVRRKKKEGRLGLRTEGLSPRHSRKTEKTKREAGGKPGGCFTGSPVKTEFKAGVRK